MITKVMLVDDHRLVRAGLHSLLAGIDGITVVGEADDGATALQRMAELAPHVVITDIAMKPMNGLELAEALRSEYPAVKVIMLSMHSGQDYVQQALKAGAVAYLVKDAVPQELAVALQAVARGETYLSPAISRPLVEAALQAGTAPMALTLRQRQILTSIALGQNTKEIAFRLQLSTKTVETHRAQIMERLGIRDIPSLVRFAIRAGLVSAED